MAAGMWQETTQRRKQPGRPRIAPRIQRFIRQQAYMGLTPAEIERALRGAKNVERHEIPDRRTIQRYAKRYRPPDPSAPWSLAGPYLEDTGQVLDIFRMVLTRTEGRVTLTQGQAERVVKVGRARPDLDYWSVYRIAAAYDRRTACGRDTADLDIFLAFAPWMGMAVWRHFESWVKRFRPEWLDGENAEVIELPDGSIHKFACPMADADGMVLAHDMAIDRLLLASAARGRMKRGEPSALGHNDELLSFWVVDEPKGDEDDKAGE